MAASFAVHAALAAPLVWFSLHRPPVMEPPLPPAVVELMDLPNERPGALLEAQSGAPRCSAGKAYVGIGVQSNVYQKVVVVPESYPAFKAGLRRGDVLTDPDMEPDAEGYDTVDFTRHGKHHRLRVKTQWICLR